MSDDLGTSFSLDIHERSIHRDYGIISDEKIKQGDLGANLPAGEVYIAPWEMQGEGAIFCPLALDKDTYQIIKNCKIPFKNGKIILDAIEADSGADLLIKTFNKYIEIDRQSGIEDIRTTSIAEFGIGCNPEISKSIGYTLTDEKVSGSVHLAFGENKQFGGSSFSKYSLGFCLRTKGYH